MNKIQLTKEGKEKLQVELQDLKESQRQTAVDRLQKARSMGDLSENSEYTAAKEGLAFVEERIKEIEEILKHAAIVDNHHNGQEVSLGSSVTVDLNGQKETFYIVGEYEADPMQKKLSNTSPIGKALLGQKVGNIVEVDAPAGKTSYKILEIK
jgi:transcription elongation factor GreA